VAYQVSLNVRFRLWWRAVPRQDWVAWLAERTGFGVRFSVALLRAQVADESVTPHQLEAISRALEFSDDGSELLFHDLLHDSHTNVFTENLKFLFDGEGRGSKKNLAETQDIDPTTISRWLSGVTEPEGPNLEKLASYFQLPWGTDLRKNPIFLSLEPVSSQAKRNWVRDHLDKLSEEELQDLYPALRRMLEQDR
jgi:transcriptional regulator with XRE-family HTH domain